MTDCATVLSTALNEVEYGIVLLDKGLRARFINRAYYRMVALKPPPAGVTYSYADLVKHARTGGLYDVGPKDLDDFAAARVEAVRAGSHPPAQLRLSDGRILKTECVALPDGGRMLTFTDVSEMVHRYEQLRTLARTDDLTKLLNRRHFLASFEEQFARAHVQDQAVSLVMFDADHFKRVNDRHGHCAGDVVLRALADRCRCIVQSNDMLGRLGGEEFAALTGTELPDALEIAERLREGVAAEPFEIGGEKLTITVSVGIAARRARDTAPDELLHLADRAMYAAKANGRNCIATDLGAS